jgi:hypothetical protein
MASGYHCISLRFYPRVPGDNGSLHTYDAQSAPTKGMSGTTTRQHAVQATPHAKQQSRYDCASTNSSSSCVSLSFLFNLSSLRGSGAGFELRSLLGGSSCSSFACASAEIFSGCAIALPCGVIAGFDGSFENVFFAIDRVGSKFAAPSRLLGWPASCRGL